VSVHARRRSGSGSAVWQIWPSAGPPLVRPEELPPQPPTDRVKVLHVITRFAGGAGANTFLSAAGMDPDVYETWVAGGDGGPLWQRAKEAGVRSVRLPRMRERIAPLDDAIVLWQLFRLIRRERFSVVHTHCSKGGFLGRLAAGLARAPVVVHTFHAFASHSFMGRPRRALYLTLDRLARRFAHRYVAVSPRVAREAVEHRLVPPGSVVVVPSGLEMDQVPDRPDPSVRKELGIPEGAPVVGWVGRMVPQKAPLHFVRMAAIVRETHGDAVFVMVGDASFEAQPLERRTHREARRLGVDIVFTGFRPDAPRIASTFDVYVVSSLYEGLGRGLTEAMASGRPVVATAVNGVRDLVIPGSTGLLARPGDPATLASCVDWMLDHPEESRQMGARGKSCVSGAFDQATMCSMLDRVYSALLGLPEPAPKRPEYPLLVLPPDSEADADVPDPTADTWDLPSRRVVHPKPSRA